MDSDWMNDLCQELSQVKIKTYRFEFPYMQERRDTGKKRPPNPARVLEETWLEAIKKLKLTEFFVGGKSMGSRIASHIIPETEALGLIAYGFPFHAPGKPLGDRHEAMLRSQRPTLIVQGERDAMGNSDDLKSIRWPKSHKTVVLSDGDHSLKPRKASGFRLEDHIHSAAKETLNFIQSL